MPSQDYLGSVTPTSTGPNVAGFTIDSGHASWNLVALAGWALYRRRIPMPDGLDIYWNDLCPGAGLSPGTPTTCAKGRRIYVNQADHRKRVPVVHEIGHVVQWYANGKRTADFFYQTTPQAEICLDETLGHGFITEEWASTAFLEGFAQYYAAVVFNRTNTADTCALVNVPFDFSWSDSIEALDGQNVEASLLPFNCAGEPYWGLVETTVAGEDYVHDVCEPPAPEVLYMDRNTEYDWMRFLWALDTDPDDPLKFNQIVSLWDRSNPHNWSEQSAGAVDASDRVWVRLVDAAAELSTDVEDLVETVGPDHGVDQ